MNLNGCGIVILGTTTSLAGGLIFTVVNYLDIESKIENGKSIDSGLKTITIGIVGLGTLVIVLGAFKGIFS